MNLGIYSYAESNVGIGALDLPLPAAHIEPIKGPSPNNRPLTLEFDTRISWVGLPSSTNPNGDVAFGVITIPANGCIVDWGDGQQTIQTATGIWRHTYCTAGIYRVTIIGNITRIGAGTIQFPTQRGRLTKVLSWGSCLWDTNFSSAFNYCGNLKQIPQRLPVNPTSATAMFQHCATFNQQINHWDVGQVTGFLSMFFNATSFNQSLNGWNVSKTATIQGMLQNAAAYQQSMSNWNLAACTSAGSFMASGNLGTPAYDDTLIGWNNNKLQAANGVANWSTTLAPNFGTSKYTAGGAAATARAALVTYGWTITDGGTA